LAARAASISAPRRDGAFASRGTFGPRRRQTRTGLRQVAGASTTGLLDRIERSDALLPQFLVGGQGLSAFTVQRRIGAQGRQRAFGLRPFRQRHADGEFGATDLRGEGREFTLTFAPGRRIEVVEHIANLHRLECRHRRRHPPSQRTTAFAHPFRWRHQPPRHADGRRHHAVFRFHIGDAQVAPDVFAHRDAVGGGRWLMRFLCLAMLVITAGGQQQA
jgi:hypothetical protein